MCEPAMFSCCTGISYSLPNTVELVDVCKSSSIKFIEVCKNVVNYRLQKENSEFIKLMYSLCI